MTATRFYLPSAGAAPVSPAFEAWDVIAGATRRPLARTKTATSSASPSIGSASAKVAYYQFVSDILSAQTIGGNLTGQIQAFESASSADVSLLVVATIYSKDGSTRRAGLLAFDTYLGWSTELNVTAAQNRTMISHALTPYACALGDRLVIEIGVYNNSGTGGHSLTTGDNAGSDLAVNNTQTTAGDPWVQFDSVITFATIVTASGTNTLGLGASGPSAIIPTYRDQDGSQHAVTIDEKAMSRRLSQTKDVTTLTRVFIIQGTKNPVDAAYMGPPVGSLYEGGGGLIVSDRDTKPYSGAEYGNAALLLEVKYTRKQEGGDSGVPELSYQFGSESEHRDTSLTTQTHVGSAKAIAIVGDLINVSDHQVNGVEVAAPIIDFTEQHIIPATSFNSAYRKLLRDAIQKVNKAAFRDYAAGEVLFSGCQATKVNLQQYSLVFNFRARRNYIGANAVKVKYFDDSKPTVEVPATIDKKGWQYIWATSTNIDPADIAAASGPNAEIRIRPRAFHVADVYEEYDFSLLAIGVAPLP